MSVYPFLGMRGTGDFNDDARPQSWSEKILELFPNGSVPLTAITKMGKKVKPITDPRHNWKVRKLSDQAGAVTNIYIDVALNTAYVYATHHAIYGVKGATVYAKVSEATCKKFRAGHQVILRDVSRGYEVDVRAKVTQTYLNGSSSIIACRLLEDDDNSASPSSYNLATVDRILVTGNINPRGGIRPPAITYDPFDVYNVTAITRTPLELDGTTLNTKLRSRDAYIDAREQALLYHGIELEKNLIWSNRYEGVGENGKEENAIMGIMEFLLTYAPTQVDNYVLNSDYSGKTWLQGGEDWLNAMLQQVFSMATLQDSPENEVLALCGAGAAGGIQRLIRSGATYFVNEKTKAYGLQVVEWRTIFGTINLKIHPLFSYDVSTTYMMLIVTPRDIIWRPLGDRDTHFRPDILYDKGGGTGVDGKQEEFLTEGTYEYDLSGAWGLLYGVGQDNAV